MLGYLLLMAVVLVVSFVVGMAVPVVRTYRGNPEHLLIALWVGLLITCAVILALCVFVPLESVPAAVTLCVLFAACLGLPRTRAAVRGLPDILRPFGLPELLLLLLACALVAAQRGPVGDEGLYHYQLIHWLSEYGAVPGLALLHMRFGTASSWLALHAAMDVGVLERSVDAVGAAVVLFLVLAHLLLIAGRAFDGKRRVIDLLAAVGYLAVLPYLIGHYGMSTYVEIPLSAGTIFLGWLLLHADSDEVRMPNREPQGSPSLDPRWAVLVLAAGLATLKVSGLLVWLVVMVYVVSPRPSLRRLLLAGGLSVLMLSPLALYNLKVSGCPLFPTSVMCVHLPWTVDFSVIDYGRIVRDWARWHGSAPPHARFLGWLLPWIRARPMVTGLAAFGLVYGFGTILRWSGSRRAIRGSPWLATLAVAGIAFTMATAPSERFLRPYLYLMPALFAARCVQALVRIGRGAGRSARWSRRPPRAWRRPVSMTAAVALAVLVLLRQPVLNVRSVFREGPSRMIDLSAVGWLLPTKVPTDVPIERVRASNFTYFVPVGDDRCWAAPLPCTPALADPRTALRDPREGLGGGFVIGPGPER